MKKLQNLVNEIGEKCNEKHYSLVTAESCTGGGLAYSITKNPSCSAILERGYIVYSIASKEDILGVSTYTLQTFGVVSKEVAKEMAEKALEKSKSHISIAITGIDENAAKEHGQGKGLVWISCAGIGKKTVVKSVEIKGDRGKFCDECILECLNFLADFI